MDRPKIYRFDYMSDDNFLHHKYYSCQNIGTAISQFEAGCSHKHVFPEKVEAYECADGCHKWALVYSSEKEDEFEE